MIPRAAIVRLSLAENTPLNVWLRGTTCGAPKCCELIAAAAERPLDLQEALQIVGHAFDAGRAAALRHDPGQADSEFDGRPFAQPSIGHRASDAEFFRLARRTFLPLESLS